MSVKNQNSLEILWYFFKPNKGLMMMVLGLMLLSGFLEACNLAAIYPILNYGLKIESENWYLKYFEQIISVFGQDNLFVSASIFLIILTVLSVAVKMFYHYTAYQLVKVISQDNQKMIFTKLREADYSFFVRSQQGQLVYAGTMAFQGVVSNTFYVVRIISSLITCVTITGVLLFLAWQGTLVMLGFGLFYAFLVKKITSKVVNRSAQMMVGEDRNKNVILNEFITGIKSIKVFHNLNFWQKKYYDAVDKSTLYNFYVMMGRTLPDSFIKLTFFLVFASAAIFLGTRYSGNIVFFLPLLGTFAAVSGRLLPYMNLIGSDFVTLARYFPDTKVVYDFLHQQIEQTIDGNRQIEEFKQEIFFNNLSFKYKGMDEYLLKNVSFALTKSNVVAIVGPSGSGKSTLVSLLFRLYDIQEGKISWDGIDIKGFTRESYLKQFGYVGQETFIFNGTIRENIAFGLENISDEDLVAAAKLANAHEFIQEAKKGYDTIVGDAGMNLSGGQRQRIAIARAMLRKPKVLVLDEATSSLDTISERNVQEAINRVAKQTTVLIIAHRLSTVKNANQIIVLDQGRIIEMGSHEELIKKEKMYSNLYNS